MNGTRNSAPVFFTSIIPLYRFSSHRFPLLIWFGLRPVNFPVVHPPIPYTQIATTNSFTSSQMFRTIASRTLRSIAVPRPVSLPLIRTYAGFPALTRDLAKERIIELLEGYDKVTATEITEESSFNKDLGLDSLDVVEVVMEVEHEFNIQIPDEEADSLKSVGQTIDYILAQPDAV